jgi:hypothetical protein
MGPQGPEMCSTVNPRNWPDGMAFDLPIMKKYPAENSGRGHPVTASSFALDLKREARTIRIGLSRSVIRPRAYSVRSLRLRRIEFSVHTAASNNLVIRLPGRRVAGMSRGWSVSRPSGEPRYRRAIHGWEGLRGRGDRHFGRVAWRKEGMSVSTYD